MRIDKEDQENRQKKLEKKKKKIMIVDDDRELLEELKEMLYLAGYDTAAFSDGTSALKMVNKIRPDLILLDLKMSGKNGFEVAGELRRSPTTSHIPVIAMTGFYTGEEHISLMNSCGIKTRLIKPFNPLDAISQIEKTLAESENDSVKRKV